MMFAQLCVLAAAALPFVASLTLDSPTNVTSGERSNITWTASDSDPSFSLELNHPDFNAAIALANNVDPTSASPLALEWPIVPADSQYTLSAVNISNINQIFSQTGQFAIAQAPTSASASLSTTFTSGSTVSGSSTTASSPSGSGSSTGGSTTGSGTGSTSSPSSTGSGNFNGNGAASFRTGNAAGVVAVLAAVAGATLML